MTHFDLVIIGAGAAGLSVASGAAQMGAKVALIEAGEMGGDCLNTGCVPSKALIAAAEAAQDIRKAARFGIASSAPKVDFAAVMAHVHKTIADIAPHDSQDRFEGLGVTVYRDWARFTGPREITVGDQVLTGRRIVIATGSRPFVPPIDGLADVPYLTNETVFDLDQLPDRLMVLGGGPIGAELAQAFARLGSQVVLVEAGSLLGREDPEAVAVVRANLQADGVDLREGAIVRKAGGQVGDIWLELADAGTDAGTGTGAGTGAGTGDDSRDSAGEDRAAPDRTGDSATESTGDRVSDRLGAGNDPLLDARISGTHLLIATGRAPNVDGLGLDLAGVETDRSGVITDARLRTGSKHVFAIGDVVSGTPSFTHVAGYHAGIVIRQALLALPAKADHANIARVTYTAPELAHVGLTEADARAAFGDRLAVQTIALASNDRARAEALTEGFLKLMIHRGRPVGATIVGPQAGELIAPWVQAIGLGTKLSKISGLVLPYPTLSEMGKGAAGAYFSTKLFGNPLIERGVRWIQRLIP